MFGNSSLANFVSPVPICQSKTALGSILRIFSSTKCRLLAIALGRGNWGIIYAEDLLSLMSRTWMKPSLAVVSDAKSVSQQSDIPHTSVRDFDFLIRPATVYQADTSLQQFLSHFHDTLGDRQTECLVVNALGKLQGRLDRNRILKYLAAKTKVSADTSEKETFLSNLKSLTDAIALPLKIESAAGTVYLNASWEKLIMGEVADKDLLDRDRQQEANHLPIPPSDSSAKSSDRSILDADLNSRWQFSSSVNRESTKLEPAVGWNYLKVPLTQNFQQSEKNSESCYWLVMATKVPVKQADLAVSNSSDWELVGKLLASVSHQLKSPLTGIVGLSSLLGEKQLGTLNQRQERYANLIHSSSQSMMSIVNDVLKLVSLTTKKRSPELVNLEFLCRQVYQQVVTEIPSIESRLDTPEAGELELSLEPGNEIVTIDREILFQILFHLMLETHETVKSSAQLRLKISSFQGGTVIEMGKNSTEAAFSGSNISSKADSGSNLAIAQYLAATIGSSIDTSDSTRCQFTLRLATVTDDSPATDSLSAIANSNQKAQKSLTILCLYPEPEAIDSKIDRNEFHLDLKSCLDHSTQQLVRHRIIEADSLEQADTLARIWQLDIIILDSYQVARPETYLRSLLKSSHLANLPLITLDAQTTEAANQLEGLNVYPCLLPAQHRSVEDLLQVIAIATES